MRGSSPVLVNGRGFLRLMVGRLGRLLYDKQCVCSCMSQVQEAWRVFAENCEQGGSWFGEAEAQTSTIGDSIFLHPGIRGS
jgi:hypothetical protein